MMQSGMKPWILCCLLGLSAPVTRAELLPVQPYSARGAVDEASRLNLPLEFSRGGTIEMQCLPAPEHSDDLLAQPTTPALKQLRYVYRPTWRNVTGEQMRSVVVQIRGRDETTTAPRTAEEFGAQREHYRLTCLFDFDGNRLFENTEQSTLELKPLPAGLNNQAPMWGMNMEELMEACTTSMTLTDASPRGLGEIRAKISFPGLLMPRGMMWGQPVDPLTQMLQPHLFFHLRGLARLPDDGHMALQLDYTHVGDAIIASGYRVVKADAGSNAEREAEREIPASKLDAPFEWKGAWWKIAAVDGGLSTVTLARTDASFQPPPRGEMGGRLPDWARLDFNTRELLTQQDLTGRQVLLAMTDGNERSDYNGFRLMAERLKQAAGSKSPLEVVFVIERFDAEAYFAALAGTKDLAFRLVQDRDIIQSEAGDSLGQLLEKRAEPLVILTDAEGKVILREESELYPLLPRLLRMLSDSDGTEQVK